jgi:hypothetical protein
MWVFFRKIYVGVEDDVCGIMENESVEEIYPGDTVSYGDILWRCPLMDRRRTLQRRLCLPLGILRGRLQPDGTIHVINCLCFFQTNTYTDCPGYGTDNTISIWRICCGLVLCNHCYFCHHTSRHQAPFYSAIECVDTSLITWWPDINAALREQFCKDVCDSVAPFAVYAQSNTETDEYKGNQPLGYRTALDSLVGHRVTISLNI